jgi:hypothetical protein
LTETASFSAAPAEAIEIRVERAAQLFDTLDPFPFREKGLDPSAEKYIVDWARELGRDRPLRIVIHLPVKESCNGRESELAGALKNLTVASNAILLARINLPQKHDWFS